MVTRETCLSMRTNAVLIYSIVLLIMSEEISHSLANLTWERGHPLRRGAREGASIHESKPYPHASDLGAPPAWNSALKVAGNREPRAIGECRYVYLMESTE